MTNRIFTNYDGDYLTHYPLDAYPRRFALRCWGGWALMHHGRFVRSTRDESEAVRFVAG